MRFFALVCALAAPGLAASIKWTGYANNGQWETRNNWYPNTVPGPNDDVTINKGSVTVTAATGVNSLSMGNDFTTAATLTLYKAFYIGSGGLTVQGHGTLVVSTGLASVSGQVNVAGNLKFIDGSISGVWTADKMSTVDMSSPGEKALVGCQMTTAGVSKIGGVIVLNQSSVLDVNGKASATGTVIVRAGDKTSTLFDSSKGDLTFSKGNLQFQAPVKIGTFTIESGNVTLFSTISFNKALNVPAGSFVAALGSAVVEFPAGITGSGVVTLTNQKSTVSNVNFAGALNIGGAANIFAGGSSKVGILTILGGQTSVGANVFAKQLNLLSGVTSGLNTITGEQVYTKSKGFTLGSVVVASKTVSFDRTSLTFAAGGNFTIASTAIAQTIGTLQAVGAQYLPGLVNNGVFNAAATVSMQNIPLSGTGSLTVSSTFTINSDNLQQASVMLSSGATLKGAHATLKVAKIAAKAADGSVKGALGQYTFECPKECVNVKTTGNLAPAQSFSFSA